MLSLYDVVDIDASCSGLNVIIGIIILQNDIQKAAQNLSILSLEFANWVQNFNFFRCRMLTSLRNAHLAAGKVNHHRTKGSKVCYTNGLKQ